MATERDDRMADTPSARLEDALCQQGDRLAEAEERIRRFAYLASHDLRSPLRAIRQLISFMTEDHAPSLPGEVVETLDSIDDRIIRLDRSISDLLEVTTRDLGVLRPERCDIGRLIHDIGQTIETRGKHLVVTSDGRLACRVTVSPLTVCLRHLIDNACRHHDRPTGMVRISSALDEHWLTVEVADDGPGIASGHGLGLTHLDQTVARYSATLSCERGGGEDGRGTVFTLRWPIEAEDDRPPVQDGLEPATSTTPDSTRQRATSR